MYLSIKFCINQRISNLAGYLVHGNHVAIQSRIGMKLVDVLLSGEEVSHMYTNKACGSFKQVHISTSSLYKMLQN